MALERGGGAGGGGGGGGDALLALLTPVVECNRVHVGNGRVYLREMLFGDPEVPGHAAALAIIGQTEQAMTELIGRHTAADPEQAARQAQVISAAMYVTMAASPPQAEVSEVVTALEGHPHRPRCVNPDGVRTGRASPASRSRRATTGRMPGGP